MNWTPADLIDEMLRASRDLEDAQRELVRRTHEASGKERLYRMRKAKAYMTAEGTVAERDSLVHLEVETEWAEADISERLSKTALEAVRNKRQVLSSLQSIAAAVRSEAELARTGGGP